MRERPGLSPGSAVAGRTGGAARVAAIAVLLAVTVVGLRAHAAFSRAAHSAVAGAVGVPLAVLAATGEGIAVVAFLVVLVMARPERKKNPDTEEPPRPPFPWWAKTIAVLVAVAVMVTPLVVLFSKKSKKPVPVVPSALGRPGVVPTGAGRLTGHAPGGVWPLIAGMVIAIAIVVALTVWSRRRRSADRSRPRPASLARLLDSLNAGHDALAANADPRAAIIACYAAMERGFAAAGSAPAAADTPAEVLARAAEAGIIRSGFPEQLTGLFRRARYSADPVTSADSGAAATALEAMRADLLETQGAGR
jgi:NADH:ubiquinone oxidoreductase subunit 5 (subunit L)/multisubunit Na+/H+ antiporter MnhA subunit